MLEAPGPRLSTSRWRRVLGRRDPAAPFKATGMRESVVVGALAVIDEIETFALFLFRRAETDDDID